MTYTLNDWFGAGMVAGDTGVLLNDEMDDFTAKVGAPNQFGLVQGEKNAIAAGQDAAELDDADRRASRTASRCMVRRHAGRQPHHHRRHAGDPQRDRLRHVDLGGRRRAAHPQPMAAGHDLRRAFRAVAGHAQDPRSHGPPFRPAAARQSRRRDPRSARRGLAASPSATTASTASTTPAGAAARPSAIKRCGAPIHFSLAAGARRPCTSGASGVSSLAR